MPITTGTGTGTAAIPAETAQHVLWQFGHGGYPAGTFTQHLLSAMAAADPTNFARLAGAFPEIGAAVDLAQNHRDGIAQLQHIAAGA